MEGTLKIKCIIIIEFTLLVKFYFETNLCVFNMVSLVNSWKTKIKKQSSHYEHNRHLFSLIFLTAAAGNHFLSITVRAGDDVTLPCEHVIDGQRKCDSTTWLFSGSGNTVELFELGQIKEEARDKSDRLSVREKCSLVIKKVTEEDAGRYTCRQFRSGQHQGPDTLVDLSVTSEYLHHNVFKLSYLNNS